MQTFKLINNDNMGDKTIVIKYSKDCLKRTLKAEK